MKNIFDAPGSDLTTGVEDRRQTPIWRVAFCCCLAWMILSFGIVDLLNEMIKLAAGLKFLF